MKSTETTGRALPVANAAGSPRLGGTAWGAVLLAALTVITTLWGLFRFAHPVMYKDSWEMIGLLEAGMRGGLTFGMLWEQWAEHRILFPKMLYLADYILAGGTGYLLIALSAGFQGILVFLLARAIGRSGDLSRGQRVFLSASAAAVCFWMIQSGDLLWGFQVAWFLNALGAVIAAYLIAGFDPLASEARKWARIAGALLAGMVAAYSLANGVFIWPILSVILWKRKAPPRFQAAWAVGGVLVVGAYFVGYQASEPPLRPLDLFGFPAFRFVLIYLGNPLSRLSLFAGTLIGAVGLGLFCLSAGRFLFRGGGAFLDRLTFFQLTYVVVTAAVIAAGRSHISAEHALSSRYYPPVLLFWFFLLLSACRAAGPRAGRKAHAALLGALALVIAGGQWMSIRERAIRYVKAEHSALALVTDVADTGVLYYVNLLPARPLLWEQNDFLRTHGLAHFKAPWTRSLGKDLEARYSPEAGAPIPAHMLAISARGEAPRTGRFLWGKLQPRPGDDMPAVLLVVEDGKIAGFATTAGRSCDGCFSGYVRGAGGAPFALYGLGENGRTIRPVALSE